MAKTPAQKAREAKELADSRAKAAAQAATNKAKTPAPPKGQAPAAAPAQAAPAAAAPAPAAAGPASPVAVDPFFTADDIDAINQFTTDLATKLEGIDFGLKNAETDTTFKKTQNETAAKQNSSAATDDAISRGIFASSIKDASLYDIEAQRSLSAKFLDDNLTAQRLTAGTNKQILGTAKTNFDQNMASRKVANAQGVNDVNNTAWAAAKAAWDAAHPVAAPVPGAAPVAGVPNVPGATGPHKGVDRPLDQGNTLFAATPTATPVKFGGPKPGSKPKVKTTTVQYGAGTA